MEIRDWILITSAVIVVAGWFVNGYLNRRHEIAKKRMEYRLEALHSFLPVFFSIQKHKEPFLEDPDFQSKLEFSRTKFQLYGRKDEVEIFEAMVKSMESKNISAVESNINKLINVVKRRIRNEIGINT